MHVNMKTANETEIEDAFLDFRHTIKRRISKDGVTVLVTVWSLISMSPLASKQAYDKRQNKIWQYQS